MTAKENIEHLLHAGAKVTVVSPDVCNEIVDCVKNKKLTHTARNFQETDIEGALLVYAATNSHGINRHILECCRRQNILCYCADGNWNEGDFTIPATMTHNKLTLSVSSSGNNGRKARMIQNSLTQHLKMMESAHLIVIGTDHHHLTVEEREPFHLTEPRFERTGFMIMQLWGIHEFMLLNTCNRIELIAVVSSETAKNGILRHIMGFTNLKEDKFYFKCDRDAFEHLALVTSGMLSQTPGENHITAQMKDALETCKARGWAGNILQEWISNALHISKTIKNQIGNQLHRDEIENLSIRYLEAHNLIKEKTTLMILGAGMVGKGLIKASRSKVGKIIWCYHINRPEPESKEQIELFTFNEMKNQITHADIIICATDAPGHILHVGHAPFFNQERPLTIIDLGMPRNVAPQLEHLSTETSVIGLDELKYWHRHESVKMTEILTQARSIIAEHQTLYDKASLSRKGREGILEAPQN